ncbi:MAG TPA: alpha/beta hydrolase [Clostridiales bacterium]|nr:alpha/beta hydrolase [Clostridiales bacterium]
MNKSMRLALKALSYVEMDMTKAYKIKRQVDNIASPRIKSAYKLWDHRITGEENDIDVRIFLPNSKKNKKKAIIFFHGGGWVVGNIDTYSKICDNMAKQTGHIVVSVDYRLAPENKFPKGLEDCYTVTQEIFSDKRFFNIDLDDITIVGDSAGGNLAAAVSLMARDRGGYIPKKQILIYPALWNDYTENSIYQSVHDNGKEFLLTSQRLCDYMKLYINDEEDLSNPYLAPLLADDLSNQPETLIITAEYDPLRDEGEEYAERLKQAGNIVKTYRMKDALHGFIALPKHFIHVKRAYEQINDFLNKEGNSPE